MVPEVKVLPIVSVMKDEVLGTTTEFISRNAFKKQGTPSF